MTGKPVIDKFLHAIETADIPGCDVWSEDATLDARDRAAGTVNHLTGAADRWETGIPTYEEVVYHNLWPKIDLVFRGEEGKLKYEFHLHRGADSSDIRLAYTGADGITRESDGSLAIDTGLGELDDARPVSYQRVAGERVRVPSRYDVRGDTNRYGFAVGSDYDDSRRLVIDPGIDYSTFLGGTASDSGRGIAVDDDGNVYVTGQTASADYPTTPGAVDPTHNGGTDAFLATVVRSGSALAYSTFLGGTAADVGNAIAVDEKAKVAYVTGSTESGDFPTSVGAFDTTFAGSGDAFVTKLGTREDD